MTTDPGKDIVIIETTGIEQKRPAGLEPPQLTRPFVQQRSHWREHSRVDTHQVEQAYADQHEGRETVVAGRIGLHDDASLPSPGAEQEQEGRDPRV